LVPPSLSALVMKALARNVADRFQSCREMADALARATPMMFDEGKAASYMSELFPERVMETRALFAANLSDVTKLRGGAEKLSARLAAVAVRRPPVLDTQTFNTSDSEKPGSSDSAGGQQVAATPRILVVDDSQTIITVLNNCLSAAGYEVEGFVEPKKA